MTSINDIRTASRKLLGSYNFTGATLFGSYANGTATDVSDIDIYVEVPEGTKTKQVFAFAYDLGEALGIEVDAYGSHEVPSTSALYSQIKTTGVML